MFLHPGPENVLIGLSPTFITVWGSFFKCRICGLPDCVCVDDAFREGLPNLFSFLYHIWLHFLGQWDSEDMFLMT